jgi:hypothetical protein
LDVLVLEDFGHPQVVANCFISFSEAKSDLFNFKLMGKKNHFFLIKSQKNPLFLLEGLSRLKKSSDINKFTFEEKTRTDKIKTN